jgi:ankyrin repeat protein
MATPPSLYDVIATDNVEEFHHMITRNPIILNIPVPSLDGFEKFPIHYAAEHGSNGIIRLIAKLHPESLDVKDSKNRSSIIFAIFGCNLDTLELFVQLGSTSLDTPDDFGNTPLHWAAFTNNNKMIELLIKLGSRAMDTPGFEIMLNCFLTESNTFKTLLALGYDQKYNEYCAANNIIPVEPFDEDEVAEIRWRVYFQCSLVYRCLF